MDSRTSDLEGLGTAKPRVSQNDRTLGLWNAGSLGGRVWEGGSTGPCGNKKILMS
jgi:hypothetical protein